MVYQHNIALALVVLAFPFEVFITQWFHASIPKIAFEFKEVLILLSITIVTLQPSNSTADLFLS